MSTAILQRETSVAARCLRCSSAHLADIPARDTGEVACLICGWRGYYDLPPAPRGEWVELVRYGGDSPHLRETVTTVRMKRGIKAHLAVEMPSCPFCGLDMEEASLSGRRRNKRERRFKCAAGHRISLLPRFPDGRTVWQ